MLRSQVPGCQERFQIVRKVARNNNAGLRYNEAALRAIEAAIQSLIFSMQMLKIRNLLMLK